MNLPLNTLQGMICHKNQCYCSSHELSCPKKIYVRNSLTYAENDDGSELRYPIDIKSVVF